MPIGYRVTRLKISAGEASCHHGFSLQWAAGVPELDHSEIAIYSSLLRLAFSRPARHFDKWQDVTSPHDRFLEAFKSGTEPNRSILRDKLLAVMEEKERK